MMYINRGFQIDNPKAFIPWGITEQQLISILGDKLRRVTDGYYSLTCESLGGLKHELGFHFEPRRRGLLQLFEFFRRSYPDLHASFDEFQSYFVREFGAPTKSKAGSEGFPDYTWRLKNVIIKHYIFDRFGPEEHMTIEKSNSKFPLVNLLSR